MSFMAPASPLVGSGFHKGELSSVGQGRRLACARAARRYCGLLAPRSALAAMPTHTFDLDLLYAALERERRARGKSWKEVAAELDVDPTRFTRLASGDSVNL